MGGGIAGVIKENVKVEYCYNLGTVTNNTTGDTVGGVVGILVADDKEPLDSSKASSIRNCYNTATVSSLGLCTGGICGFVRDHCSVKNCYVTSDLVVERKGKQATANRGISEDYIGKIVGKLNMISSEYMSSNTNEITVSVYYVVSGRKRRK